ncbi:type II 3-dehydroquinate dehydratase [Corynebacterium sp. ES2794-CONJ1]|uniref:type II 3-dehydroquinate dehydratase n=1 Tax=unclassified Corynebacterium TaxID=2624378 RepID=UPI002168DA15|nr:MULTISPECIES: type II 3-dehydroquinate dehydratase [unclassified Corynebacterium]MCS4489257.1 type II 3-dehydroquinate dehydratase [Corynebacterium sp. ES2775-CONJ]MCS4491070.1 type II 3-dehydroquinate dehydratase [Corynebacterium sp. ES2715-CONJ3]MCS4531049.1 type II 3-dehydroquinate dehydratase [Corynebacterium sp. ES2730-CONJ]MCU9518416.1 type II 3-dehydroquinate dehydratase [Corynebacterium sp. ES2794-CONJ1]
MSRSILILNGPNLDRLGKRQPHIYGSTTLAQLEQLLHAHANDMGFTVTCKQSNYEGELVEWIHEAVDKQQPIIINPGGLTHTSVVLRDALAEISEGAGFIEVHLSNIAARESFRHHSYLSPIAKGTIAGLGVRGYLLALDYLIAEAS